jgi:hypothetical protein
MSEFLETLKARLADAQSRMAPVQAALLRAQQDHVQLAQEVNSWANAVNAETRREQQETAERTNGTANNLIARESMPNTVLILENGEIVTEINKTRLIRDILQQNPGGLRPVTIWQKLQDQVPRAYVYSVLSRMKQKKQVRELRGKYYLSQPTPKSLHGEQMENH